MRSTLVNIVVTIFIIIYISVFIIVIIPTAALEQKHRFFHKRLVCIESKEPCWTVTPLPFFHPAIPFSSAPTFLLSWVTYPEPYPMPLGGPRNTPSAVPTVILELRPSASLTYNPPPMPSHGPIKMSSTGPTFHSPCVFQPFTTRFLRTLPFLSLPAHAPPTE